MQNNILVNHKIEKYNFSKKKRNMEILNYFKNNFVETNLAVALRPEEIM